MGSKNLIEKTRAKIRDRGFTTLLAKPKAGVYLFFSFDLVNSTQFKASHPGGWAGVVTRFYELIINEFTTRLSSAIVWKYVGDEVLFFKTVRERIDLHLALPAAYDALIATTDMLHSQFPECRELLAVKGTAWIAEAQPIQPSSTSDLSNPPRNITLEIGRSPTSLVRDFLGPEIDAGFRISKFALQRRLVVSAELACVLYRERSSFQGIEDQLRIVAFQTLRGVWGGRHYPIVWYEKTWENVDQSFLYDEHITSEIAHAVIFNQDSLQKLEKIEKVFADLGRSKGIDKLVDALRGSYNSQDKEEIEIEIPKERYAELHCVAVCFSPDGLVLAARRPHTKRRFPDCLEFGCGQLRLGETIGECLRRSYNDDFGVEPRLSEPLIPIGVFEIRDHAERRVIPGIIFIAEMLDPDLVNEKFARSKHSEILWINPDEFDNSLHECVPDFGTTLLSAVDARSRASKIC